MNATIESYCKELRLPSIRSAYQEVAETCREQDLSYEEYLLEMLSIERTDRHQRRIERLLKQSKLPLDKTIDNFNLKRLDSPTRAAVKTLLSGDFLQRCENVLAFGNPGTGKTHLLCAIGRELVYQGHHIYKTTCSMLVQRLLRAKADLRLEKELRKLSRFEAILIDDIGYVQQSREEMEVLFTLLAQRYETGSVMLTSNLPFSKWEQIFKDPMTTAAAIDRLVHHSVILELNLDSYRMQAAIGKKKNA